MPRLLVGKLTCVVLRSKHRRAKMVNNCCVVGCTNTLGRQMDFVSIGCRWLIEVEQQKAAAVRRDPSESKAHTRICGDHFKAGNDISHAAWIRGYSGCYLKPANSAHKRGPPTPQLMAQCSSRSSSISQHYIMSMNLTSLDLPGYS